MAKSKIEHVVVDAVAFFRNVQLQDIADNIHTSRSVVNEIRDKATRQRLGVLPYDLKFRDPATECIQIVSDFARKTGDYQSLSATDIRVMALAYQLTKECVGIDHLKQQPEKRITYSSSKKPVEKATDIAGFYFPGKKNEARSIVPVSDNKDDTDMNQPEDNTQCVLEPGDVQLDPLGLQQKSVNEGDGEQKMETVMRREEQSNESRTSEIGESGEKINMAEDACINEEKIDDGAVDGIDNSHPDADDVENEENMEDAVVDEHGDDYDDDDDDVDDDEDDNDDNNAGWITPQNISQVRRQMGGGNETSTEGIKVGCMTTDFAMQNVLIQIGIPVISVNGMLIKCAKSFVLRCHDCFKVTSDMNKLFCPKCGNKSLDKVTVTVDEDGTQHYHLSRRKQVNIRGMRYALPKPQGGKHASNPILCADQRIPQNREPKKAGLSTSVFDPDYVAMNSPFATKDVTSRAAQLGVRQIGGQGSQRQRNPNENRKQKRKGRRK